MNSAPKITLPILRLPLMVLFLSLFSPLSGLMEKAFGQIFTLLLGAIIVEICFYLFCIQRNIWFFYSIALISGFGAGISVNIPVKNACMFYPEKKGLISAGIMSFVGVWVAIFILIGEKLINPEKEGVIDQDTEPYYSEEVSKRFKNYYFFAMLCLPIETLISLLLFYKYDPNCEIEENENENKNQISDEDNENNEEEENEENEKKEELKEVIIEKRPKKKINCFYKPSPSKNIKIAMKSFRFWRNILIGGVTPFWVYFLQSSYRAYVVMLGVDTNIIFFLGSGLSLVGCLLGPIWASLVDKFGFQPIMKIIGFICSGMSVYFYFFMGDKMFYTLGLIMSVSTLIGVMASLTPHLMQIYGIRYYLTIGGFAKLFNELSNFLAALTSIILSIFFKNADELLFPYQMVVAGGGVLSIIGFILIFFENDEKFVFGDENEENKYSVKEGEEKPSESFEREKEYINENASTILDPTNSSRVTLNTNENSNDNP